LKIKYQIVQITNCLKLLKNCIEKQKGEENLSRVKKL